jgi:hypothetical protein
VEILTHLPVICQDGHCLIFVQNDVIWEVAGNIHNFWVMAKLTCFFEYNFVKTFWGDEQ